MANVAHSALYVHPAVLHMKGITVPYYYVSIFLSTNSPFSVHLTGGQCGSWYKECLWPLKAWPHWPEAVYVVPTGNDSLQIQIRSTVVFATPTNTCRPSCRLLSGSADMLKDHVLCGKVFQWELKKQWMNRKLRRAEMEGAAGKKLGQPSWNMYKEFSASWPSKTRAISGISCRPLSWSYSWS